MTRKPQPADIWPGSLHFGCLGCSGLVAAGIIAGAVYLTITVGAQLRGTPRPSSTTLSAPLKAVGHDGVAVLRAQGFTAQQVLPLASGGAIAVGSSMPGLGAMFGQVFANQANPEKAATNLLQASYSRVLLLKLDGTAPIDVSLPQEGRMVGLVDRVCVSQSGDLVAATVTFVTPSTSPSPSRQGPQQARVSPEIWLLDVKARQWRRLLPLSAGHEISLLGWLPSGHGILGILRLQRQAKRTLCVLRVDGTLRQICDLPRTTHRYHVSPDGKSLQLAYLNPGQSGGPDQASEMLTVDLATGKITRKPIAIAPAVQPGALSPDETLVRDDRLGALSWRASRLRWITWQNGGVSSAVARPDGKWAIETARAATPPSAPWQVIAVDLSDGTAHAVGDATGLSILSVAPDGRSFLASLDNDYSSPLVANPSCLLQLYVNWSKIAREPAMALGPPSAGGGLDDAAPGSS